jgi:hypothetical protein
MWLVVTGSHTSARCMCILHYAPDVCASGWVYDPVTTSHMLYRDERPIQYSGVMYVSPHKQRVLVQIFCPTSWRNSYKNEVVFCEDRRSNVLLWLKFVFMTFESQNDRICGTPTSTGLIIILPPLQNGINSALKI